MAVYIKLNEFVVDVPSLVANLKNQLRQKNAAIIQAPSPFRWQQRNQIIMGRPKTS